MRLFAREVKGLSMLHNSFCFRQRGTLALAALLLVVVQPLGCTSTDPIASAELLPPGERPGDAAVAEARPDAFDEGDDSDDEPFVEGQPHTKGADPQTVEQGLSGPGFGLSSDGVGSEISAAEGREALPPELNAAVDKWIEYFTVRDRGRFQRFLERGEKYRPLVTATLREQGVPTELFYLALIESGFATGATSHAKAVGIWQFMKGTAKRYGLRVDAYVDERRDPIRATIAAALYLNDLHNVFQSWYLAMAAYNAGEGRVMGAIMRAKSRDFWQMVEKRALPQETIQYVPKFLAASIIGHDLRRYGFDEITPEVMPLVSSVPVPSPVKLESVAKLANIAPELLAELNPHLRRGVTPPGVNTYRIWVPRSAAERVVSAERELASLRVPGLKLVAEAEQSTVDQGKSSSWHRVKKGENLATIAQRYGVSVEGLRSANKLRNSRITAGARLRIPAGDQGVSGTRSKAQSNASLEASEAARRAINYKVQSGESLDSIAKRYNLTVTDIKKLNGLRRSRIYAGQVLKLPASERG